MPLAFTTGTSSHPKNTLHKRKFEIKVLLFLHILIPGVMLSSLETINPWLSACDLRQQSSSDLKGTCSAMRFPSRTTPLPDEELLCPKECPPNESKTNASCLAYLDDARRSAICNFNLGNGIEWLKSFLGTIRLRHCCEYKIIESLSQSLLERVLRGKDECFKIIDSLVEVDNLAARVTCEFSEILSRYDCGQPYSVKFSCNDCLEAYRRWVCSTLVPYFNESIRIRPCRSVCQSVEQKCPYFLPENKAPALPTQYAGEPTFLCMDPNIPETGEQQKRSLYPDNNTCCVKICGSLKDGLCVDKGSSCKSEDLISYEEALDQTVECGGSESGFGSRVPSLECTASEAYSSPHKLGSGADKRVPSPAFILFAYLSYWSQFQRSNFILVILVFHCYFYPFLYGKTLAFFLAAVPTITQVNCLLLKMRIRAKQKLFISDFVKCSKLIFNYFKFNTNKWQYYFILISVNLLRGSFIKPSEPLTTPDNTPSRFKIKNRTTLSRERLYYYYFHYNHNYYYYKHYYTILWRIAQHKIVYAPDSRKTTYSTRIHLKLVIFKKQNELNSIRVNIKIDDSLTTNSLTVYRVSLIIILIITIILLMDYMVKLKNMGILNEALIPNGPDDTGTNTAFVIDSADEAAIGMLVFARKSLYLTPSVLRLIQRMISAAESVHGKLHEGQASEPDMKLVNLLCCLPRIQCSDPQCEFQTLQTLS